MKDKTINLIPDKYVGKVELFGNWGWSGKLTSPMMHYPETLWCASKKPANIKYLPKIESVGLVRISAYIVGNSEKQNDNQEYVIHFADGIDNVYVDTSNFHTGESDWFVLGTYRFDGNGKEYVQLNHNCLEMNTRASTLRFEILNDAKGDVWQYLYVGPAKKEEIYTDIVELNRFSDLESFKYQRDIEKAYYLNLLDAEDNAFKPHDKITDSVFSSWISKMCGTVCEGTDDYISLEFALKKLINEIKKIDINLEWLGNLNDISMIADKIGLFEKYPEINNNNELTRADAAVIIYHFYHWFIASAVEEEKWRLSFVDDFDGEVLDERIWECENRAPAHILSSRWAKNVSVKNSVMSLTTKKEKLDSVPDKEWTTASVWVKPNYFKQYGGYWQASIKINAAKGLNNAFWMIGNGSEIDIVEAHYINSVHTNYHFEGIQYSENFSSPFDLSEDFHIYALEWTEQDLIYYFDGKEVSRKRNIDAHSPLYPIFSTAVINWAGNIPDSADGCSMDVEWIRIYERKKL